MCWFPLYISMPLKSPTSHRRDRWSDTNAAYSKRGVSGTSNKYFLNLDIYIPFYVNSTSCLRWKEYDYFLIVNLSLYSSPEHNAQVCFSYHLASGICRPLSFHILIFFSKTAKSNWTKLGHDTPYMFFFQNSVRWPCPTSKMAAMESDWLKNWKSLKIFLLPTERNDTKFRCYSLCDPFQSCVRWSRQLFKMVATVDYVTALS